MSGKPLNTHWKEPLLLAKLSALGVNCCPSSTLNIPAVLPPQSRHHQHPKLGLTHPGVSSISFSPEMEPRSQLPKWSPLGKIAFKTLWITGCTGLLSNTGNPFNVLTDCMIPEILNCRFGEIGGVHLSSKAPGCSQSQVQVPWNSSKATHDPASTQAPMSPASPGPTFPLQLLFPMILGGSCLSTSLLAVPIPRVPFQLLSSFHPQAAPRLPPLGGASLIWCCGKSLGLIPTCAVAGWRPQHRYYIVSTSLKCK